MLSLAALGVNANQKRPNILFIISDDHSHAALGTRADDTLAPLPALRRLANEGMVFDRSYCTNSISGPSRASIMTGRHSHKNGFLYNYGGDPFNPNQPTWPQMLQEVGYQTGLIGKWHLKSDPRGFDSWEMFPDQGDYWNSGMIKLDAKGKRMHYKEPGYVSDMLADKAIAWLKARDKKKPFALYLGHKAPHRNWIAAPRHLKVIRKIVAGLTPPKTLHDSWKNRPGFFRHNEQNLAEFFCNWHDAHLLREQIPFEVMKDIVTKPRLRQLVNKGHLKGKVPANFNWEKHVPKYAAKLELGFNLRAMVPAEQYETYHRFYSERTQEFVKAVQSGKIKTREDMTTQRWRWYMEDYLACVMGMDESVGEVLDYLDESGLASNTLVMYVGDQSFYLGEHGLYDKRLALEESFRMPLIIRWPGKIAAGTRSQALVQNIDYAPTFLSIAGADSKKNMVSFDGRSLLPLFKSGKADSFNKRALYYAFFEQPGEHNAPCHDAIRDSRYTLAHIWTLMPGEQAKARKRGDEWLLIDNEKDPLQMRNLINDPAYAKIADRLIKQYWAMRRDLEVPDNSPSVGKKSRGFTPTWKKP